MLQITAAVLSGLTPTERSRIDLIDNWDLSDVKARVSLRMGWSDEQADEAVSEYRKFIALVALEPDNIYGMAEAVDEVWHQHLLNTRDYLSMCNAIMGGVIHHEQLPLGTTPNADFAMIRERTIHDLAHKFVGPLSDLWSSRNMDSMAKCCQGHCTNHIQYVRI